MRKDFRIPGKAKIPQAPYHSYLAIIVVRRPFWFGAHSCLATNSCDDYFGCMSVRRLFLFGDHFVWRLFLFGDHFGLATIFVWRPFYSCAFGKILRNILTFQGSWRENQGRRRKISQPWFPEHCHAETSFPRKSDIFPAPPERSSQNIFPRKSHSWEVKYASLTVHMSTVRILQWACPL